MKKISNFLVEKRYIVLMVMIIITLLCGILTTKVTINSDMTKYLPDDSSMKQGLDIMDEEFPEIEDSGDIRIMFNDLKPSKKLDIQKELEKIEYVDSVDYEADSAEYNNNNHTLYIVNFKYDYNSDEAASVEETIVNTYDGFDMVYYVDTDNTELPVYTGLIALGILMIILFLMSASWLEPFLFLATIGVAIIINMGTNCIFASVSETTYSIAAILQLVLSMDYSIILINRYRQELLKDNNTKNAMKNALAKGFSSIASSSVTTIVGLLALCFMSFKIGMDLGIVLAKGVLISMLCIFTVLPALILLCDKGIRKTSKKELTIKMDVLGRFSNKFRYVITGAFVVIFVVAFLLSNQTKMAYVLTGEDPTEEYFTKTSSIVLLYENKDEEAARKIAEKYEDNDDVKSVQSYGTTIGKKYTASELADNLSDMGDDMKFTLDASLLNIIYYDYFMAGKTGNVTASEFMNFLVNDVLTNEAFTDKMDANILKNVNIIKKFADVDNLTHPKSIDEIADFFGMDKENISQLFLYNNMKNGGTITSDMTLSIQEFVNFIISDVLTDERMAANFDSDTKNELYAAKMMMDTVISGKRYSAKEMNVIFSQLSEKFDENTMELLYLYYFSTIDSDSTWTLSIEDMVSFLVTNIVNDSRFSNVIDDDMRLNIADMQEKLADGGEQLKGSKYSRLIITTTVPDGSEESAQFMKTLQAECDKVLIGNQYLIGNAPMEYEMSQTFKSELNFITILTAIAIFIVVAFTFRSFLIPLILVLIIQCGIYLTTSIIGLQGYNIYYLALLIVQCILMGATIDYGILFTNYFRENRKLMNCKEALIAAYNGSIHTILTSGLIMVLVTGIVGYTFKNPTIGQICQTISKGALCAILLIIFILPGILSVFDKYIVRKKK